MKSLQMKNVKKIDKIVFYGYVYELIFVDLSWVHSACLHMLLLHCFFEINY